MIIAYTTFVHLIEDTSHVDAIYKYMKKMAIPLDISDLLRWQWVQTVSAFDKFIHDIVKRGMIEQFIGIREKTNKFNAFSINMSTFYDMTDDMLDSVNYFEQIITKCNGYKSFQDPKKVSNALSYIWNENYKWKEIANNLNMNEHDCTVMMNNIVIRRNQIAHEGDYVDVFSRRQSILEDDVNEVKNFISRVGEAIYNLVKL